MSGKDTKISKCPPAAELTALLYDELSAVEREWFEDHLADCFSCVDEFAELSEARLSAYEWNRYEFADLPTPVIRIDYSEAGGAGWLAMLRTRLSFAGPVLVFGSLAVMLAFGYFMFAIQDVSEPIARIEVSQPEARPNSIQPTNNTPAAQRREVTPTAEAPRSARSMPWPRSVQVASVSTKRHMARSSAAIARKKLPASGRSGNEDLVARKPSLPRLTNSAEVSDNTLRLADVFSELGINE